MILGLTIEANWHGPLRLAFNKTLRTLGRQSAESKSTSFDSSDIVELWELMVSFLNNLLSPQGILGEVVEFWQTVSCSSESRSD